MRKYTLADMRRERGMTTEALARKIDRPLSTVSNWMAGRNTPNVIEAIRICDALGCTVYDIDWETRTQA